ncbi:MAG TPA: tRNA lysidine(34) synthetase TilS [Gemmatimonadales bacterium]|nr:tRNA lysidine(34) synthetase TilS [Gemmatimonadales bacterium]
MIQVAGVVTDLSLRLLKHANQEGLFPAPGLALLAVSGGPDSLALLDLLHRNAAELGLRLMVAHVDHGIAPDSGAVAAEVQRWVARYDVPGWVTALRLGPGTSETRARAARYRALRALQRTQGAAYLVTAHHRDDQVETVLLRVLKGTGMRGLAGIPARGPGGLVRPLLPFGREELADWLRHRYPDASLGPAVHHDPANQDPRHERSWVRSHVLPLFRHRLGTVAEGRLLALGSHARAHRRAWAAALHAVPNLQVAVTGGRASVSRSALCALPDPLAQALLEAAAGEAGHALTPRRAARILGAARRAQSGRWVSAGPGWVAEIVFDQLVIRPADQPAGVAGPSPAVRFGETPEGCVVWDAWEVEWRMGAAQPLERQSLVTWITPGPGEVRGWRSGERITPLRGRGHRPVRRLLMEARVPRGERPGYPVISRHGEAVWLPGVCRGQVALPAAGQVALRIEARRVPAPVGAHRDPG